MMNRQFASKTPILLSPEERKRVVDYVLLLMEIDAGRKKEVKKRCSKGSIANEDA